MPRRILFLSLLSLFLLALLCACSGAPDASSSGEEDIGSEEIAYPTWNADTIYHAGEIVEHEGKYFRVLWWTRGTEPTVDGERDVWQYLGEAPQSGAVYFPDISETNWYAKAVTTLAASGMYTSTGISETFQPNHPLTRAQFAVWLCRALEIAPSDGGDNYPDAGSTWYTPYLAALRQKGWAFDGSSDYFRPDLHITRQEMCALVYFLCDGFSEDPATAFAAYTDADQVAPWAIQAMSWCIERGIITCQDDLLAPARIATRAEGSQIVYNLIY